MAERLICPMDRLPPRRIVGVPGWAVGNTGTGLFAVSRRCRHLAADLAGGSIDRNGCLACPWHGARYDVTTGEMTRGPRGFFARIPGYDLFERAITWVWPLRRRPVAERDGSIVFVDQ